MKKMFYNEYGSKKIMKNNELIEDKNYNIENDGSLFKITFNNNKDGVHVELENDKLDLIFKNNSNMSILNRLEKVLDNIKKNKPRRPPSTKKKKKKRSKTMKKRSK